jgi:hypothetical protein
MSKIFYSILPEIPDLTGIGLKNGKLLDGYNFRHV